MVYDNSEMSYIQGVVLNARELALRKGFLEDAAGYIAVLAGVTLNGARGLESFDDIARNEMLENSGFGEWFSRKAIEMSENEGLRKKYWDVFRKEIRDNVEPVY